MKVLLYSPEFRNEWNQFLVNSKNGTFLFHRDYMEYHSDRFRDYSLVVKDDQGKLLATLPANVTPENIVISHQGLTYGGLVVRKDEKLINIMNYFKEILHFLFERGIPALRYKELPHFYNEIPGEEHLYTLFLLNARLYRRDVTITINNRHPLPYQERRIRAYESALKDGVEIEETTSLEEFWNTILTPNLIERYGVKPTHSLEEINLLHSRFPENIRQFNAYLNGNIMAGATVFETPAVAHVQYIGSSNEGRQNGSLDLLFHTLIKETFAHKKYFDFGICNEENGLKLNEGLLDWKEGFGGRAFAHNFYEIETSNYIYLDNCIKQ